MVTDSNERHEGSPRWGYLLLAALIFVLVGAILAGLWQLPRLVPQFGVPTATTIHTATATHTSPPPSITPVTPTETPTSPPPTITPTPTMAHPTITELTAEVDEQARTITFGMAAGVPPDRRIDEVLLWYDTETGHEVQYFAGPLPPSVTLSHELDAVQEGLTTTHTLGELDYWWLVSDTSGESVRAGGTASLGPSLQALIATPAPTPPPIDFTWTMSESQHYRFHAVPGTAAERDLPRIGPFAEAALSRTTAILEIEFDDKMDVYLVPRLFWQGGASYSDKVQLISYLDRNYASVETWSYFTHEGTHALAQDLLQPKEHDGRPDGVLVEGLAVWASGGHYRREPLDAWAAVLAASDEYIPLADLRNGSFYEFQHEISYLEAASFIKFLVEQYGLDKLKELYGLATGDADNDEALFERLYGQDYAGLEAAWLDYLAGLEPTPEQAETWRLTLRSFDLMRRYETDLDPDARILPSNPPTEWTTDTLKIFLHRLEAPVNVVLETALIAAQDRLYRGDLTGAATLLDDVEATLDANPVGDLLGRPSLLARRDILELVAAQDRAVLRADLDAYLDTIDPASALDVAVERALQAPLTAYEQAVVRLDVASDGLSAQGVVLVHGQMARGVLADDGQLFAVAFVRTGEQWRMSARECHSAARRWEIGGTARSPGDAISGD